jgi:PPOX class probable F420-dependent enzyme
VTFSVLGDSVVTSVDQKPKASRRLQRLKNIEANPNVTFLADHYEEDWRRLWWVRVDGEASIMTSHQEGTAALVSKYRQYVAEPPPGPFIVIEMERVSWWAGTP